MAKRELRLMQQNQVPMVSWRTAVFNFGF